MTFCVYKCLPVVEDEEDLRKKKELKKSVAKASWRMAGKASIRSVGRDSFSRRESIEDVLSRLQSLDSNN